MRTHLIFFVFIVTTIFNLTSCSETKSTTSNEEKTTTEKPTTSTTSPTALIDLVGTTWVLKKYLIDDKEQKLNHQPVIQFEDDGKTYGIQLDVNSCGGSYTRKGNTLTFEAGGFCTEACCDSEQSKAILAAFSAQKITPIWDEKTKMLTFNTPTARLYWTPKVDLKEELVNTKWKLQHFIGRGEPKLFEKDYFITFSNGRATLELDVNVCNAPYTVLDEKTIQINSPFGCSRKCCDSQQGQDIATLLARKITLNLDKENLYLNIPVSDRSIACIPAPARD